MYSKEEFLSHPIGTCYNRLVGRRDGLYVKITQTTFRPFCNCNHELVNHISGRYDCTSKYLLEKMHGNFGQITTTHPMIESALKRFNINIILQNKYVLKLEISK